MNRQTIAAKASRNPFAQYDLDPSRGIAETLGQRPRRPEGTPGLAAWFAGRMLPRYH